LAGNNLRTRRSDAIASRNDIVQQLGERSMPISQTSCLAKYLFLTFSILLMWQPLSFLSSVGFKGKG
jgi:hypothetical protein